MLNDQVVETDLERGMPALDFLREQCHLQSTKDGCREGDCGACTVLVGTVKDGSLSYQAVNSCLLPLGSLRGCHLVTLEGILGSENSAVQRAIVDNGASQCGFCTPGVVMALMGFLLASPVIDEAHAFRALAGNLCRCTGYAAIKRAARALVEEFSSLPPPGGERLAQLMTQGILPAYFGRVADKLPLLGRRNPTIRGKQLIAGGTDVLVQKQWEMARINPVFLGESVSCEIWEDLAGLHIGAMATVESVCRSALAGEYIPGISKFEELIASAQIRGRATVGGNIVNASPIGDMTVMLLAMDAQLYLRRGKEYRSVPLDCFFKGYKELDLRKGEVVELIDIPRRATKPMFHFEKVCKRDHLDIASVNSAISLTLLGGRLEQVRIAAGGVAPVPLFLRRAARALEGERATCESVKNAAREAALEIAPIGDVRGSAEYKRLLLTRLIYAHFNMLLGLEGDFG